MSSNGVPGTMIGFGNMFCKMIISRSFEITFSALKSKETEMNFNCMNVCVWSSCVHFVTLGTRESFFGFWFLTLMVVL